MITERYQPLLRPSFFSILFYRNLSGHHFNRRWIGRRGQIEWPLRSPDFTLTNFFLFCYRVYFGRSVNFQSIVESFDIYNQLNFSSWNPPLPNCLRLLVGLKNYFVTSISNTWSFYRKIPSHYSKTKVWHVITLKNIFSFFWHMSSEV